MAEHRGDMIVDHTEGRRLGGAVRQRLLGHHDTIVDVESADGHGV